MWLVQKKAGPVSGHQPCLFSSHLKYDYTWKAALRSGPLLRFISTVWSFPFLRSSPHLRSSLLLRSSPTLLSGMWSVYENWRRSIPERRPPLSLNSCSIQESLTSILHFTFYSFRRRKSIGKFSINPGCIRKSPSNPLCKRGKQSEYPYLFRCYDYCLSEIEI